MPLGLTYSATCQIYWVIWDFPVLSPDRDILCFAQKRFGIIKKLEREVKSSEIISFFVLEGIQISIIN